MQHQESVAIFRLPSGCHAERPKYQISGCWTERMKMIAYRVIRTGEALTKYTRSQLGFLELRPAHRGYSSRRSICCRISSLFSQRPRETTGLKTRCKCWRGEGHHRRTHAMTLKPAVTNHIPIAIAAGQCHQKQR